jgi:hypothetical protein
MNIPIKTQQIKRPAIIDNDIDELSTKYERIKNRLELNNSINAKEAEILKIDYERKLLEQTHEIEQKYAKKLEESLLEMRDMLDSMKIKNEIQKQMLPTLHKNSSSEKYKTSKPTRWRP